MIRIKHLALVLSVAACGGEDATFITDDFLPPGAFRMDGDVDRDHIFYNEEHRNDYCAAYPESPACSELGTSDQAWVSAEYHGLDTDSDAPCYATDTGTGNCLFPSQKRIRYVLDQTKCFPTLNNGDHDPVDTLKGTAIVEGIQNGLDRWHNAATGVSVENNACSTGTCMTVNVSCDVLGGNAIGLTTPTGSQSVRVNNLPSGPNGGIDQDAAITVNGATMVIDPGKILAFFRTCTAPTEPTRAQLRTYTRYLAAHETGHAFGFGHFDAGPDNVMFPIIDCADTAAPVLTPFANALSTLNTSDPNDATILDLNLELQGPG